MVRIPCATFPRAHGPRLTVMAAFGLVLALMFSMASPALAGEVGAAGADTPIATQEAWPAEQSLPRFIREDAPNAAALASRTALHHTHVDAGHLAWNAAGNTTDVQVVNGTTPVDADTVYVRVGPEADTDGREISRVRIPASPRFRFLGEAGTIIWNAPEKWYRGWSPVWSGLGSGHDFPSEIDPDSLTLELTAVRGPEWASVWNGDARDAREFFSTRNPGHTRLTTRAGAHGHYSWSFEKPGRYTFVWRGLAKTKDGKAVVGPEREIIWLVGTDEDLGLAAGTWHQRYPITTPTEDQPTPGATEAGEGGSDGSGSGNSGGNDAGNASDASGVNAGLPLEDEAAAPEPGSYTCLAPAHYDLEVTNSDEWNGHKGDVNVVLHGDVAGEEQRYGGWEAMIPIPDSAIQVQKIDAFTKPLEPLGPTGTRLWLAPQNQAAQVPWVGFTTERADFSAINEDGLRLYAESFTGPGRMLTFTSDAFRGMTVHHDSRAEYSKYTFTAPTHSHLATVFNQPGLYDVAWKYAMTYNKEGWFTNEVGWSFNVYYAVGNERIEQLCPGWLAQHDVPAPEEGANPGTGEGSEISDGGASSGGQDSPSGGEGSGESQPGEGDAGGEQPGTGEDKPGSGDTTPGGGAADSGADPGEEKETGKDKEGSASEIPGVNPGFSVTGGTTPAGARGHASADLTCRAVMNERPASQAELARLRAGTIGAEPGAAGRVNHASTTLTFSVGPNASGNATSGHFDLGPVVSGGTIAARVKDDRSQPATWRPGSALRFAVGNAGKVTAPASLGFLTSPGAPVWLIGTTQNPRVPWVGLNSQHPGLAGATTGSVTFHLDSVSGPGRVAIFESGALGGGVGRVLANGAGSSFTIPPRTHAHHNWAFSQPGTYTIVLRMSVTPTGGALAALTDIEAGQGRVWVTARHDGAGRPIVREMVGRRADGSACDIALPEDILSAPAYGAYTAAYHSGGGGTLLDAADRGTNGEAENGAAGGLSVLEADKAAERAAAAGGAVEVVEAPGLLQRDWSTSSVIAAILAVALAQAAATVLILAARKRKRLAAGAVQ